MFASLLDLNGQFCRVTQPTICCSITNSKSCFTQISLYTFPGDNILATKHLCKPSAGLISDDCSKDHNRDSGETRHECRTTNEADVIWEICMCDVSQGHMMQIERLGEPRADSAENTCEIEKRTGVLAINSALYENAPRNFVFFVLYAKPYDEFVFRFTILK